METGEAKGAKYINSVIKAVDVINVIARSEEGLGVTEISQALGYTVSATYHLLNTLRLCNMVEQDRRSKKYRVGFAIFRIGSQARGQNLMGSLAMGYLEELAKITGETASLSILSDSDTVCIAQAEGRQMVRTFAQVGSSSPFYYTCGGKALVACQPRETWEPLIRKIQFVKYTDHTITSVNGLIAELEETRQRGYGLDLEEREVGVICVGAPVFDCNGEAAAAISISGPAYRMRDNIPTLADRVRSIAMDLSIAMGYVSENGARLS